MPLRAHLDGRLFAEHVPGAGPAIVALHGWGRDRHDLLPALAGREVVSFDLPGFGASPPPAEAWGAAAYAELVAEALDRAGGPAPLVVGHSFGGRVAACLGAARPDLVAGVVFVGTPLLRRAPGSRPRLSYRLVRSLHRRGLVSDRRLEAARFRHGSADYRAAEGIMRAVLVRVVNEDYRDELARLRAPVGFYWGAGDTAAPPEVAREAAALVARPVVVEVVDGAGHDVHRQAPEGLGAVVDAVAAAVGAPPVPAPGPAAGADAAGVPGPGAGSDPGAGSGSAPEACSGPGEDR